MDTTELAAGHLLVIDDAEGWRLRVLRGTLWLTRERDAHDAVLHAGDEATLPPGRTVVEALGAARLQCLPAPVPPARRRALASPMRAARRMRAQVAAAIARLQFGLPTCR